MKLNDKNDLRQLDKEILAALKPIADKYNLTFTPAGGKYSAFGDECDIKLKCKANNKAAVNTKGLTNTMADLLSMYGLAGYLNKEFTWKGKRLKVTGINSRCRTKPVMLDFNGRSGGKSSVKFIIDHCPKPTGNNTTTPPKGTLTQVPFPGTVFGTAREIAGGRMWTIHHDNCKGEAGNKAFANFHSGKLPRINAIVKCKCGQEVQITEALTFEDQL